jgi:Cytidylyltransferase-like
MQYLYRSRALLFAPVLAAGYSGTSSARALPQTGSALPVEKLACHLFDGEDALSRRQSCVLVACGSYNPITLMHLRMFEAARDALQKVTSAPQHVSAQLTVCEIHLMAQSR